MDRLCMIVHYDCFKAGRQTVVREASFASVRRSSEPVSHTFDLTRLLPLTPSDRAAADADRRHVHGLDFAPDFRERPVLARFFDDVTNTMYRKCETDDRKVVGHYAGHLEERQLVKLRLPLLDLRSVGCPRYRPKPRGDYEAFTCGLHSKGRRCGRAVVAAYRDWVLDRLHDQDNEW